MTDGEYFRDVVKGLAVVYAFLGVITVVGLAFWGAVFYAATALVRAVAGIG